MKTTIGNDRLGSGGKMQVDLKTFNRSTHNLSYLWRSTMASGTLVPFLSELALPGDTFDINLNCIVNTMPTIGPLFGSYKIQLDIFQCPIRLYIRALHNNKLGVGLDMAKVKLPQIEMQTTLLDYTKPLDNQQINPSAIFSYLGTRGVGNPAGTTSTRQFNALPFISYWDIYKNYYANKQEEIGAFINNETQITNNISNCKAGNNFNPTTIIPKVPTTAVDVKIELTTIFQVLFTGITPPPQTIKIILWGEVKDPLEIFDTVDYGPTYTNYSNPKGAFLGKSIRQWRYIEANETLSTQPQIATFPLSNIDDLREAILAHPTSSPFIINSNTPAPFGSSLLAAGQTRSPMMSSQEGLALKTYQSDLFNNWMKTEWIDGTNGINEITAIDTSSGQFTLDTFILARKVYDMLNQIAISGGSYRDYIRAVWGQEGIRQAETPMYMGGLIKELEFQEVVSNSAASTNNTVQPLGTLAGKGVMGNKHKGGNVTIKVDEPSYIIGLISLTPLIDNSQGNKWDIHLKTMDDFHKPHLDNIGFQDAITEQMAWWDTKYNDQTFQFEQRSAGKQPAWINYMTNVNQVRGNFAILDNQMWMTLNRRYEYDPSGKIKDLTTYIDPVKFNQIFAQTARDAQNFWVQIAIGITARRMMSAKVMPNL